MPPVLLKTLLAVTGLVMHLAVFPTSAWTADTLAAMSFPRRLIFLNLGIEALSILSGYCQSLK